MKKTKIYINKALVNWLTVLYVPIVLLMYIVFPLTLIGNIFIVTPIAFVAYLCIVIYLALTHVKSLLHKIFWIIASVFIFPMLIVPIILLSLVAAGPYYHYKQHSLSITQVKLTEEDENKDGVKDELWVQYTIHSNNIFPFEVINHSGIYQQGGTMPSRINHGHSGGVSPQIHFGDNTFYTYFKALTPEQCLRPEPAFKNPYIYIDVFDTDEDPISYVDKKIPLSKDLLKYSDCPNSLAK